MANRFSTLKVVLLARWGLGKSLLDALDGKPDVEIQQVVTDPPDDSDPWRGVVYKRAATLGYSILKISDQTVDSLTEMMKVMETDVMFVHAFDKLLPPSILSVPALGCVNVHPSLLPNHRGRHPTLAVLKSGDKETGLTAHLMDEHFDTGPILTQKRVEVRSGDSRDDIVERLKTVMGNLVDDAVEILKLRARET